MIQADVNASSTRLQKKKKKKKKKKIKKIKGDKKRSHTK
jgi:hypothetical protein